MTGGERVEAVDPRRSQWLAALRQSDPSRLRDGSHPHGFTFSWENRSMRRSRSAIVGGVVVALAVAFSGCGGDSGTAPGSGFLGDGTTVEFKSTDTSQFEGMKNQMMKNMQTKAHTKKPAPPKKEAEEKKP